MAIYTTPGPGPGPGPVLVLVLVLSVLEGWALRGRTVKMLVAAERETHNLQTQPPETASCVLRGHLSVVPPGLRESLRLCLLFKDIATTAPPGGSAESKQAVFILGTQLGSQTCFGFGFTGSGFEIHIKALGVCLYLHLVCCC